MTATESHDHFVGCNAPSRIKWRTELLAAIRKQLNKTKTNANLSKAIINAIDRALAGRPISVTGHFAAALREQESIGWRSMLQGYWAPGWTTAYRDTYVTPIEESSKDRSKRLTGMERWQTQLIQSIWTHMISLWKLRNDERHGRDKETRELARHTVLTNELRLLYLHRNKYPQEVQAILKNSFDDHCKDKASKIDDWLNAYRVTFQVMHI